MQSDSIIERILFKFSTLILLIIILSVLTASSSYGGVIEDVFTKDRNLLAITHYNNLSTIDSLVQKTLAEINPQATPNNPVLSLLATEILIENIENIDADNWAEALFFSQPLEKNNDWVYIFHIKSPEKYIGSLLGTGNIRQEQTEDGISRYRKTDGLDSEVYYLAYGDNNLAIMSKNFGAVKKAVVLYTNNDTSKSGIIAKSDSDYTMTFHINRYFQANSRVLPNFLNMLHYDILRDLAGTTAKSTNILNLTLNYLETFIKSLISEIAIVDIKANLNGDNIVVNTELFIQYGGSLHYALSAYEPDNAKKAIRLPSDSIIINNVNLWPEEYIQFIEGIGNLTSSLTTKAIDNSTSEKASTISGLFQEVDPISIQQGIIAPESDFSRSGPVAISVLTFRDTSKLPKLLSESAAILTTGEYSEFLAEKGIKFEVSNNTIGQTKFNTTINQTEFSMSSSYFTLPDAFQKKQYILSTLLNNNLITVVPLAPLTEDQYNNTKDFCLKVIQRTAESSKNLEQDDSILSRVANKNNKPETILNLTFNPLRYLQIIMQSEAIWPTPSPPNRLPIPWREFSQYFNSKEVNTPPLNFTIDSNRTSLKGRLLLPKSTLESLIQALLNLAPSGE